MSKQIDIRLERDPRFVAAQTRLTELRTEFNAADRELSDVLSGLNSLGEINRNIVEQQALAMLSGTPTNASASVTRDELLQSFEEKTHHARVLRTAVDMQEGIVRELRAEVGRAIAADLLPDHKENVRAVIDALIQLDTALAVEHDLRESMFERSIPYSAVITPMPLRGVGLLRDDQCRSFAYMVEAFRCGYVEAADLPDVVRDQLRWRVPTRLAA